MKRFWMALLILLFLSLFIRFDGRGIDQNLNDGSKLEVRSDYEVGQTFISGHDNLYKVEVSIVSLVKTEGQEVIFHLRDGVSSDADILKKTVDAYNIENCTYYGFDFEPIKNSKSKRYYFFLESSNLAQGNIIYACYNTNDVYPDGSVHINQKPLNGDLQFRTYYKTRFIDILNNYFSSLFQDWSFFIFYFSLLAISIFLLITLIKSKSRF